MVLPIGDGHGKGKDLFNRCKILHIKLYYKGLINNLRERLFYVIIKANGREKMKSIIFLKLIQVIFLSKNSVLTSF